MTNDRNFIRIEEVTMKVSRYTIIVNFMLFCIKMIAGIVAKSDAMISDAVHSAADVFSIMIVIAGVKMSGKCADNKHPYGHERVECVAAIILAGFLCVTGFGIGCSGIVSIINMKMEDVAIPGTFALFVAVVSIVVKELLYWYTRKQAQRIHSGALMAEAWHHRTDALASIGSFIGVFGARMGIVIMDALAGIVISLFIVKAAIDIFRDAVDKMLDVSCDEETIQHIWLIAKRRKEVLLIPEIKTRIFGNKKYVELAVDVNGDMSLSEAYRIGEILHKDVEKEIHGVKHCAVYMRPMGKEGMIDDDGI